MKTNPPALLAVALAFLLGVVGAPGQGTFQNLDFESANLAGYSPGNYGTFVPVYAGLPGWSAYLSESAQFQICYDGASLGGAMIAVMDKQAAQAHQDFIQGKYYAALFGGGLFDDMSTNIS